MFKLQAKPLNKRQVSSNHEKINAFLYMNKRFRRVTAIFVKLFNSDLGVF